MTKRGKSEKKTPREKGRINIVGYVSNLEETVNKMALRIKDLETYKELHECGIIRPNKSISERTRDANTLKTKDSAFMHDVQDLSRVMEKNRPSFEKSAVLYPSSPRI